MDKNSRVKVRLPFEGLMKRIVKSAKPVRKQRLAEKLESDKKLIRGSAR